MTSLQPIRERLARAQSAFFRVADTIPAEKWGNCPAQNEWSAAELVAHLVVVERGVVTRVDQLTQKSALPIPFSKRMHLPLWLVEARVIRRKSPVPLDESLLAEKEGTRNRSAKLRRSFPESCRNSPLRYVFVYFRRSIITGTRTPKVPKTQQNPHFHRKMKKY